MIYNKMIIYERKKGKLIRKMSNNGLKQKTNGR